MAADQTAGTRKEYRFAENAAKPFKNANVMDKENTFFEQMKAAIDPLTQKEAAEKIGYTYSNFNKLISGNPSKDKIVLLSRLVDITFKDEKVIITKKEDRACT